MSLAKGIGADVFKAYVECGRELGEMGHFTRKSNTASVRMSELVGFRMTEESKSDNYSYYRFVYRFEEK